VQYHPATFGWLVGEIASRASGRPFNEFFMQDVAAPLGLRDSFFQLPPQHTARVVKLKAMPGFEDPQVADTYNDDLSYQVVFPGGGCMASARDLARFYAALVGGGRVDGAQWLKPETASEVTALAAEGVDNSTGRYQRRTLGMSFAGEPPNTYGSPWDSRTFGHGGLASSVSWADPDSGVAMAYIASGLQPDQVNRERLHAMSAAVRAAVQTS
jgi:CubicO group peptidase (beta-lactamase class C family)